MGTMKQLLQEYEEETLEQGTGWKPWQENSSKFLEQARLKHNQEKIYYMNEIEDRDIIEMFIMECVIEGQTPGLFIPLNKLGSFNLLIETNSKVVYKNRDRCPDTEQGQDCDFDYLEEQIMDKFNQLHTYDR